MADVMNETAQNLSDTAQNETAKIPATPEGMAVAYGSLVVMALVPIFFGSFRSVKFLREQKESGEKAETMTGRDAAMFPIIASCTLFGIYIFFKLFSKEYINMLLAVYFFFLGVLALSHILSPVLRGLMPRAFPNEDYHLVLTQGKDKKKEDLMNYEFDRVDLVTLALCAGIGVWYLTKKHWIANNLFGLAFSLNGVEFLQLNRISTGCILLGGLFLYDIFWVFGTEVMVTVAKSFDAPIKLVFPQDLLENGLNANNFAMLGLGDIVIPGIFIAMMLRFDVSINRNKRTYFYATFGAYVFGLLATIFVMHVFKHAQGSLSFLAYMYWAISKFPYPALLYLVPACIGTPLFVALIKGELKELFSYEDNPSTGETPSDSKDKDSGEVKANGPTEEKKDK